MKKILLFILLSVGLLGSTYVGIEYGNANNITIMDDTGKYLSKLENDYRDLKIKCGTGEDGESKSQVTLSFITFDQYLFDNKNHTMIDIGFDLIKEFKVNRDFYPFVKAGATVGSMDFEGSTLSSHIYSFSYNIGVGISYKAIEHLYAIAGIDYIGRRWQDVEYFDHNYNTQNISTVDSAFKSYVGVNYKF